MKFKKYYFSVIFTMIFILASGLSFADDKRHKKKMKFRVTITNLTRGQVFSPPIVISHDRSFRLFTLGDIASPGLALLAEEGMPVDLIYELNPDKSDFAVADDFVPPGKSITVPLEISKPGRMRFISVAGMLVTTNDALFAARDIWYLGKRNLVVKAAAYDAGSERNSEDCNYIPGPPCGNSPAHDPAAPEGYVHVHAGIHGFTPDTPEGDVSSLNPAVNDWNNPVAKITIQRVYY